jgi:voltage-gated potassium channel
MRKFKYWVYEVLEVSDEKGNLSWYVDFFLMMLIGLNVFAFVLETVDRINDISPEFFLYFEYFSVVVFTIEYVLRLWTADINPKYSNPIAGKIKFAFTPLAMIDLLAILPFYLPLFGLDLRFLRILRMFRLFRLLKFARYVAALEVLGNVIKGQKEALIMSLVLLFFLLLFTSSAMYFVEHEAQPESFSSIPATMWWGIATITTVGYGDVYPITDLGRTMAGIIVIIGIGMIALPTGILVSGFMEHLEEEKQEKKGFNYCPHCGEKLDSHHH